MLFGVFALLCFGNSTCTSYSVSTGSSISQSTTAYCYSLTYTIVSGLYASSQGAAINIVSSPSSLAVTSCYFSNCNTSSTGYGGAIFFNGTNFSLYGTCAKTCYAFDGAFACVYSSSMHTIYQCSTYQCTPSNNQGNYDSTFINDAAASVNNFNMTSNTLSGCAASINLYMTTQTTAIYLTIVNCYAGLGGVVLFKAGSSSICTYAAVINNSSPSSATTRGVIFSEAGDILVFNNSVLIGNSAPYIFYQDSTSTIFVGQCWINSTNGTITDAGITFYMCSFGIGSTERVDGISCRHGLFTKTISFTDTSSQSIYKHYSTSFLTLCLLSGN